MEDRFILKGIQRRDQECLQKLYSKYGRYVAAVAARVSNQLTKQDVEEITSDVFLKVWKSAAGIQLEEGRDLRPYLAMAARNGALNLLRKRKGNLEGVLQEWQGDSPSAEQLCLYMEAGQELEAIIAGLKEVDRVIFIRRYFYLERVRDIAVTMNMTDKAVSARIARMKEQILQACKRKGVL